MTEGARGGECTKTQEIIIKIMREERKKREGEEKEVEKKPYPNIERQGRKMVGRRKKGSNGSHKYAKILLRNEGKNSLSDEGFPLRQRFKDNESRDSIV